MAKADVYKFNDTMQMMGKQCSFSEMTCSLEWLREFKQIEAAYTDRNTSGFGLYKLALHHCLDMLMDIYSLGVIHGIRKERARRRKP